MFSTELNGFKLNTKAVMRPFYYLLYIPYSHIAAHRIYWGQLQHKKEQIEVGHFNYDIE